MDNRLRLISACLIGLPSALFAADTLVFAVDIIRHGDRTPVAPLAVVDYQWPEGPGQLTAEGMQQEYKLGVAFRKKYIEQAHLLPEHYEFGTMYVRATYYDRTIMSAESLLLGLYPQGTGPSTSDGTQSALPHAFQPVPVFSAPAKYDEVILQQLSREERLKLLEQYVYSTNEWQQKNETLKDKYPLWSRLTHIPIKGLNDLQYLGDTLFIHKLHHIPMPEGLSPADIDTIIAAGDWASVAQAKPQQIASALHSKLMTNIANYLDEGSHKNSKLKYILLSAHDTTIAGALSFLGAPLEEPPAYAANVNFSLYENNSGGYKVKINYNGKPVSIPACGGSVCELQQFIKLVRGASVLKKGWNNKQKKSFF